jgi:hypothetical protein
MKTNTKTKIILGILAGNIAVSALVIGYEKANARMLEAKIETRFGTPNVRQNCAECEDASDGCNLKMKQRRFLKMVTVVFQLLWRTKNL